MKPRRILFVHQAFPGQFGALAQALAKKGHQVAAIAMNPKKTEGITIFRYFPRRGQQTNIDPLLQEFDAKIVRAESIYAALSDLRKKGMKPDIIYVHPGWGEALFLKNLWPHARLVVYAEWFYNLRGQEVNFDPAMPPISEEAALRMTFKNTPFLHALSECDAAIAPTKWQKSRFPKWAQEKIEVIHEGLNLMELAAVQPRSLAIPSQNLKLRKGMPIVTFAASSLEPVRGFHYFMKAIPAILQNTPDAHIVIMGNDAGTENRGYGSNNPNGVSWRKELEKQLKGSVDFGRVHFLGYISRPLYLALLKLSACHVYLTTPFILSWSFLEAAALGAPIVASDTAPVREFEYLDGLRFVNFDDPLGIAKAVTQTLRGSREQNTSANIHALRELDTQNTIPKIEQILMGKPIPAKAPVMAKKTAAPARDDGLEEIVFLDD